MPVSFLTPDDAKLLEAAMSKLNQRADELHSSVRDLSFYVHEELSPILARVTAILESIDSNAEEIRYLKSKKYKEQIIKEYTENIVVQNR